MLASELIENIQKKIDIIGDNNIYLVTPVDEKHVCGFEITDVEIDVGDSIIIAGR